MPSHPLDALPTLLLGSHNLATAPASFDKTRRLRPTPPALENILVPSESAAEKFFVKNTFIDCGPQPSPSLRAFLLERVAQTCPSRHSGRFLAGSLLLQQEEQGEVGPEQQLPSPCSILTPCRLGSPAGTQTSSPGLGLWFAALPGGDESVAFAACHAGWACVPRVDELVGTEGAAAVLTGAGPMPLRLASRLPGTATVSPLPPSQPPSHPAPGCPEMPSLGSSGHVRGNCKPCAFVHKQGCAEGFACKFCHLCMPGEGKRRQKEKRAKMMERSNRRKMAATQASSPSQSSGGSSEQERAGELRRLSN